jgi:hypothetical protein
MKTSIYYLHKGDEIPFYIGKSISVNRRFNEHKCIFGNKIFLVIIDEVPTFEWKFWEKHYISLYKSWGFKLENKNNGGGGLLNQNQNTKLLISNSLKNIPKNQETINKMKQAKLGKVLSIDTCLKKSNSMKGKIFGPRSEETKLKQKESMLGKNLGIPKSEKFKENLKQIRQKPVQQLTKEGTLIKIWDSRKQASIDLNIADGEISICCKNPQRSAKGFKWKDI